MALYAETRYLVCAIYTLFPYRSLFPACVKANRLLKGLRLRGRGSTLGGGAGGSRSGPSRCPLPRSLLRSLLRSLYLRGGSESKPSLCLGGVRSGDLESCRRRAAELP